MNDRHSSETRGQIFSAPIRKLSVDEIDLVLGGGPFYDDEVDCGTKACGGVDNHSKQM
jgi:hypothetical protein